MKKKKKYFYDEVSYNVEYLKWYKILYYYVLKHLDDKDYYDINGILLPKITLAHIFNKLAYRYNDIDIDISTLNRIDKCLGIYKITDYNLKIDRYQLCFRFVHNFIVRWSTCKKKIDVYLSSFKCSFMTLTFNDDNLKYATNVINIRRALNKLNVPYIANVDYGGLKGRIHYHVFICSQEVDLSFWKYGAVNIKKIIIDNDASEKISKYLIKLTNHSFKESNKLIYSKRKRDV